MNLGDYNDKLSGLTDAEHRNVCKVANFLISMDPNGTDRVFINEAEIDRIVSINSWNEIEKAIQALVELGYLRVIKHSDEDALYELHGGLSKLGRDNVRDAVAEMRKAERTSQECVKEGVCRKCGSSRVVTTEARIDSTQRVRRSANCIDCGAGEVYVYKLVFVGYETTGDNGDVLPAPTLKREEE